MRYYCLPELLPMIEAALVANGYTIDIPLQRQIGGGSTMVMVRGAASILLVYDTVQARGEIEIWGIAQQAAAQLLESLPLPLSRWPSMLAPVTTNSTIEPPRWERPSKRGIPDRYNKAPGAQFQ
jgi:hypothetical protein